MAERKSSPPPGLDRLSEVEQSRLLRAAGERVVATVFRRTPQASQETLGSLAEVPLYGTFVSLKRGGQLRSCCGAVGQEMPLGQALDTAATRAAREDPRFPPIAAEELDELDMQVWLLWGCRAMEARGEDRAAAIEIGRHGLQIARGKRRGLLLPGVAVDHGADARQFLEMVCRKANLPPTAWLDDETTIWTFEGMALDEKLATATSFTPTADEDDPAEERPPAVAGRFYPADPTAMGQMLDRLLPKDARPEAWAGAMVPHAGWVYSGQLAAQTLARVRFPDRAVIVCPKHTRPGSPWSVAPYSAWRFPGGRITADRQLGTRLARRVPGLEMDALPHAEEHAVEVQLPILARLAPDLQIVAMAVGHVAAEDLLQSAAELADVLATLEEPPLMIISSDMSHFLSDDETRELDRRALDAMESLEPTRLYETVRKYRISMCGALPALLVMETLRRLGRLNRSERVGYATSADASGDRHRVVGYAGMLLA